MALPQEEHDSDWITNKEAAKLAGVSAGAVWRWSARGYIKTKQVAPPPGKGYTRGYAIMVNRASLEEHLERTKDNPLVSTRGIKTGPRNTKSRKVHQFNPTAAPEVESQIEELLETAEVLKQLADANLKHIKSLQRAIESRRKIFGRQLQNMMQDFGAAEEEEAASG